MPADYIVKLRECSSAGFLKFLLFLPLAGHRGSTAAAPPANYCMRRAPLPFNMRIVELV